MMQKNRKFLLVMFVSVGILLLHAWIGTAGEKTLRVGLMAPLSGPQASIGRELRDGALLAVKQINESWQDRGAKIVVFVEDEAAQQATAAEAAQRLITEDRVDLLFGVPDSNTALALMPIVTKAQIPFMTLATHHALTADPHRKWIFRGNITDDDQAKILVDYLWDILPKKKIALLYEDSPYGRAGAQTQSNRLRQYKARPVTEVSYQRGDRDFSAILENIKAAGTKGLLIYGSAGDAPAILRAARSVGLDATMMASSGWDTAELSKLPAELTNGVIVAGYLAFAQPGREEVLGPSFAPFDRAFRARFHRKPDVMAVLAYSNMICLAEAFERIGFKTSRLVEGLEKTKAFKTLLEALVNYSDEGRDGIKFIHLTEFQDGTPVRRKRNQLVRQLRFRPPSRAVSIGAYQGKIYKSQPELTMWMVLHFAFGRPPFLKDFTMIDQYGIKSSYSGRVVTGKIQVPIAKLVFRSEEEVIEALNLFEFEPGLPPEEREKVMSPTNYRNGESGRYTEGSFWAGYERHGNVLVLATGAIPLADLNVILAALHKDVETP
jgi:branched-chain amino acid transport system substrate-binding protein